MPSDDKKELIHLLTADDICPNELAVVCGNLIDAMKGDYTHNDIKEERFAAGVLFGIMMFVQPDMGIFEDDQGHIHIASPASAWRCSMP